MLRGDVHEFRLPRGTGHEQQGRRYGVIVQANEFLPRSVVLVAPTSRSARPASFRPEIHLLGEPTRILVEQVGAVDAGRLGCKMADGAPVVKAGALPGCDHAYLLRDVWLGQVLARPCSKM